MVGTYIAEQRSVASERYLKPVDPRKAETDKADNATGLPEEKESQKGSVKEELLSKIQRAAWRIYLQGKARGKQK